MRIARRSAVALVAGLFLVSISSQLTWAAGKSGALDPTFGAGGKVLTDFGAAGEEIASDLAIQSDGKIVAAGNFSPEGVGDDFALARYNTDGTLDPTFNATGKVLTDFSGSGSDDFLSSVDVQSDGKIVVAGYSNASGTSYDFALARYNPDGTLDPTFNGTGKVLTDFSGPGLGFDLAYSVAIQSDGKIVAAGESRSDISPTFSVFALARYNPDGTLDPTFNGTGKVLTDFGGPGSGEAVVAVAIQSDGKIVAAGNSSGRSWDFALARYNPDGTLDPTFNGTGKVLTDFSGSGSYDFAHALAIQPDGKIVVAGESEPTGQGYSDFALARYTSRGRLDRRFGASGKVLTNFLFRASAHALAIQPDGRIVTAGGFSFAMARHLP
jgi:uncharacterized delta-60 repeat protein